MIPKNCHASIAAWAFVFSLMYGLTGCGGGAAGATGGSSSPPPPTITGVSVSPANANVLPGTSQAFAAKVTGTGSYSSAVIWSVNGTDGGGSLMGTISATGVYAAPATAPNPNSVTVTATSIADQTKSGTSSVVIGSSAWDITGVQLTPNSASVSTGWSEQFNAIVIGSGSFDPKIQWSVNGTAGGNSTFGTIDNTGLYKAPASIPQGGSASVTATSAAAPTVTATANITITQDTTAPPVISQLSPATANAGEPITIIGTGFNGAGTTAGKVLVYFTGANGVRIPVLLQSSATSATQLTVMVPLGAEDGPVSVSIQGNNGGAAYSSSNSVQFTRKPRIRIRAPQPDLSSGDSEQFKWRQIAGSQSVNLTWTASTGSVASDGTYTAPSGVTADTYVTVTACVQGTIYCDSEMLGVHPFRITPQAPVVASGRSIQLQAVQGSSILSANWVLGGPGSLSNTGMYTASSQFADGGGIPFVTSTGGASEDGTIAVAGNTPGLVNRVADYFDGQAYSQESQYPIAVTSTESVAIVNNLLYAESTYYTYMHPATGQTGSGLTTAQVVDVYDITDRLHPVWIDAFEPLIRGKFSSCGGFLYQWAQFDTQAEFQYAGGAIASYDLSGTSAVPVEKVLVPPTLSEAFGTSGCTIAALTGPNGSSGTLVDSVAAQLSVYQLQNGSISELDYGLEVPKSPNGQGWQVFSVGSNGKRVYMELMDSTLQNHLTTFDLTTGTPTMLSMMPGDRTLTLLQVAPVGDLLFGTNGTTSRVFDVSGTTPAQLTELPGGYVKSWDDKTVFATTYGDGAHTYDISDPQTPTLRSTLFDYSLSGLDATISNNYGYEAAGPAGIEVWDIAEPGGLTASQITPIASLPIAFTGNDTTGFLVSTDGAQGALFRYDLTQNPTVEVWQGPQYNSDPQALALSGTTLYEGTTTALEIMDASGTAQPSMITSIPLPIASLAVSGNSLLVGTGDNRLVVYDISKPQNPVQIGSANLPALPYQIATSGNIVSIADTSGGLLVYSIAAPSSPTLLSQIRLPEVYGVTLDGSLALLAAREYGLVIVDVSNPANAKILAHADVGEDVYGSVVYNKAFSVAALNKIAYIGVNNMDTDLMSPNNGNAEILGFDYSTPSQPRLVSLIANDHAADFAPVLGTSTKTLICGCTSFVYSFDAAQPRNVLALFPFPLALHPQQNPGSIPPALRGKSGNDLRLTPREEAAPKSVRNIWPKETTWKSAHLAQFRR